MSSTTTTTETKRRRSSLRILPQVLQTPSIAWPTVLLAFVALAAWLLCLYAQIINSRSNQQAAASVHDNGRQIFHTIGLFLVSTIATFLCFTPAHDAAHNAVGRQRTLAGKLVNNAVGRLCGIPLLSPYVAFRYAHLLHHKHTNDPSRDPDFWSQAGWHTCLVQDLYYYYFILYRHVRVVPVAVLVESILVLVATLAAVAAAVDRYGWAPIVWGVLLPQRMAAWYLAYTFDHVPHKGAVPRSVDEYRSTKRITGFFYASGEPVFCRWLLRLAIMEQDAHVIHHLYPTLPFYRYHAVWDSNEKELYKLGVENTLLFAPH